MPSIRDYIVENWDSIIINVVFISIIIILADRGGCIQLCLNRYCGIPTRDQVGECFIECGVPEFLANPVFPIIMIYVLFMVIITLIIVIVRGNMEEFSMGK